MNKALGNNVSDTMSPTFAQDTATKTGKSKRTVERELLTHHSTARKNEGRKAAPQAIAALVSEAKDPQVTAEKAKPQLTNSEAKLGNQNAKREKNDDRQSTVVSNGKRDSAYLTARIARDRPDILARMKAGEFNR